MKRLPLFFIFLPLFYTANASVCSWIGPAMGNWSDPANWTCGQLPGANDTVQLSGHSIVLNDSVVIKSLVLTQNCTIAGTGTLVVLGKIKTNNGGNQTFFSKIMALGILDASLTTFTMNAKPFIVADSATLTQCTFWMNDGGTFEIAATGVATFHNGGSFNCYHPYFGLVVKGTMYKTGSGNLNFEAMYLFENANVHIQSGYLVNYYYEAPTRCQIKNSTIHLSSGAFLRIERIIDISNSTILGPGKIWIGVGQSQFIHPNTILADIEQRDGVCSVTNGVDTLANYALFKGSMSGVSQIRGNFDWNKGSTTSTYVHGFTNIYDSDPVFANQKMLSGTLTVKGGGIYTGNDQLTGSVNIPANSVFTLDAQPSANFNADLQIFGTLRKLNTETVNIGFVINNGRIEGTGKLNGTIVSQGTLAPGTASANGTLNLDGADLIVQTQQKIEIQATQSGGEVTTDLLNLTGRLKLAGTLILLESGHIPAGDYVVIQASDSLTGSFAQVQLPPNWEILQHPFNITVRKLPTAPNAQFSMQPASMCAPAMLQFVDASTGDGLQYAWSFPGGAPATSVATNPMVTYAEAGNYTATLTLSNTLGTTSFALNFTIHASETDTIQAVVCAGDSIVFNGQYVSLPGVYQTPLTTVFGCDSLVTLLLSNQMPEYAILQTDSSLVTVAADAMFQWLDCSDFSPVPGATNAEFVPVVSGNYALNITQHGCSENSDCFVVSLVGSDNLFQKEAGFRVSPNPTGGLVRITWKTDEAAPDAVCVYDLYGRQMARNDGLTPVHQALQLDLSFLDTGTYLIVFEKDKVFTAGSLLLVAP